MEVEPQTAAPTSGPEAVSRPELRSGSRGARPRAPQTAPNRVRTSGPQTVDDIDYELPAGAIAQTPVEPRDAARLLVDHGDCFEHARFGDLPRFLEPGDLVVVNDTRVLPARVGFERPTGGKGEILLIEERCDGWWEALARPSAKLTAGTEVCVGGLVVVFGDDLGEGRRLVRLDPGDRALLDLLDEVGRPPLPPYIHQALADPERYQTVFAQRPSSAAQQARRPPSAAQQARRPSWAAQQARRPSWAAQSARRPLSAAAPTAGLHFTDEVLAGLARRGVAVVSVELAVGLDTFRPMTGERIDDHVMHSERYRVPEPCIAAVKEAERVVAVGTTAVRALETWAATGRSEGRSELFIRRPYRWQVVDAMVTNFHLPRSTLLCLVDAFVGERWRELYELALAERYRFLSFGDAMLLTRRCPS